MQLDRRHTKLPGQLDRGGLGIDEQRNPDARLGELCYGSRQARLATGKLQASLGGDFFAALRHQRCLIGSQPADRGNDVGGQRELGVQHRAHALGEALEIAVLNVAPVFAQVRGDAVGSGGLGELRGCYRVRLVGAPRLPYRRDVIDVHIQTHDESLLPGWPSG